MRNNIAKLAANTILSSAAAVCTLMCLSTAFDIEVGYGAVIFVSLLSACFFSSCFLWKKIRWALIPFAVIVLFLLLFTDAFASVGPTVRQLLHDIFLRFSNAYPNFSFAIPSEPGSLEPQSMALLFSVVVFFLSMWMAWAVGYRSCLIAIAGTAPVLLLCVIINNTPPSAAPLVILMTVWVSLLLAKERPGEPRSMDTTRLVLTVLAVLLVFSIVGLAYPKEDTAGHELPQFIQNMLEHMPEPIQNLLERNNRDSSDDSLGADTDDVLDLTIQGTRSRSDTVMMTVTSEYDCVLYLRGSAKDIYTGTEWESSDQASSSDALYAQTSLGSAFGAQLQSQLKIQNIEEPGNILFTPYGYINCSEADDITSDLRVTGDASDYTISYWPGVSTMDLYTAAGPVSESYDAYVNSTCLELDEDTKNTLYQIAVDNGYDPALDEVQTIAWVAEYIRNAGTYNLDVSRQPVNYDFATYFLQESKAGYCVHFATAAAAMFRALGIPSRYASGYRAVITEGGVETDITDQDTHAWAEVYLSGIGWVPVEATPGFGESLALPNVSHNSTAESQQEEEAEEDNSQDGNEETPETSQTPTETEEQSAEPSQVPGQTQPDPSNTQYGESDTSESTTPYSSKGIIPLILVLLLILAVIVIFVRRSMILTRRTRAFILKNRNSAVLCIYQYALKLSNRYGLEITALEPLALRAKFSLHTITEEEYCSYLDAAAQLFAGVQNSLSFRKKLLYRWIYVLDYPKY